MKGYGKILLGAFCSLVMFSGCFGEKDSKAQQQTMVITVNIYKVA